MNPWEMYTASKNVGNIQSITAIFETKHGEFKLQTLGRNLDKRISELLSPTVFNGYLDVGKQRTGIIFY